MQFPELAMPDRIIRPGRKLQRLLQNNELDPDRPFPLSMLMPHFNTMPFQLQRELIESANQGARQKPIDVRKYPGGLNNANPDPHDRKICPVDFLILNRALLRRTGGVCPKCGCRIQI